MIGVPPPLPLPLCPVLRVSLAMLESSSRHPFPLRFRCALVALSCLPLLVSSCSKASEPTNPEQAAIDRQSHKMLESEGMLLAWKKDGYLNPLGDSLMDLHFPGGQAMSLLAEQVECNDLSGSPAAPTWTFETHRVSFRDWPIEAETKKVPREDLSLLGPFLKEVDWFKKAKVKPYLPEPRWLDEDLTRWYDGMLITGVAKLKNGRLAHVRGLVDVIWARDPEEAGAEPKPAAEAHWRIVSWKLNSFRTTEADDYLFQDTLDQALVYGNDAERARTSLHELKVIEYLKDKEHFEKPHKYFRPEAFDRHPGGEVVDIDRDGLDDFYVMARWGKNMLFHNEGDGTFKDIAPQLGLDFDGNCSSAIFADFDNDGDTDALIGRTLERSLYLINEGGHFVDHSADLIGGGQLPFLASSISAVDYDSDGLLDAYICIYAGQLAQRAMGGIRNPRSDNRHWIEELKNFLPATDWTELHKRFEEYAPTERFYTDRPGPPNVLLHNAGDGRFEIVSAEDAGPLYLFRNSFQASWADYDNDGDMDVYIANDFAPNDMIRNDGNGNFVEITDQTQSADIGFGMGAGWGDYDGDGDLDLYVTNMFSKAGRRVTSFFDANGINFKQAALSTGINPVFRKMAAGNTLFRNEGPGKPFEKVSGRDPGTQQVEEGGWSWGGQFADFDNDSYLDLYTLSGYYSAPGDVAIKVDL